MHTHAPVTHLIFCLLGVLSAVAVGAQDDNDAGYPPGQLVPVFDLGLQKMPVEVPAPYGDVVPTGLTLNMPAGFKASVFAAGLSRPRFMAFSPDGVLHVSEINDGQIVALPDRDGDGVADRRIVVLDNLRTPHGLAFYRGDLYVGEEHQVVRGIDADGDGIFEGREVFIPDLPWEGWHDTRTIVFDQKNEKFYVGVGSPCDLCRMEPGHQFIADSAVERVPYSPERGTVLQFSADGTHRRIFATGVRNVVGMDLHPVTGELWGTNNGHDLEGTSRPPEWIDILRDGDFQGYPFVQGYQVWNDFSLPRYQPILPIIRQDSLLAQTQKRPVALVPAHWAPMAIHFYTGDQFPGLYRNVAFVAVHAGKAKLSSHPGYKVIALFSEPDGSNARMADFITGFQTGTTTSTVWGFPQGLMTDDEGSLYVTSDNRNPMVLKITHSLVGGSWEHNLPESILVGSSLHLRATVRIERLAGNGGPARVIADLTLLGGPGEVDLVLAGDSTYALDVNLDVDAEPGLRTLRVRLQQEVGDRLESVDFVATVSVVPHDLPVLDDGVASDWHLAAAAGARVVGASDAGPVFSGRSALALEVAPASFFAPWNVELVPSASVARQGYVGVRFAFHPGDVQPAKTPVFTLFIDGLGLDLVRSPAPEYRIDVARREWQVLEIPFEAFDQKNSYSAGLLDQVEAIDALRFEGNMAGTFYLDDVRLVSRMPAEPPAATVVTESREEGLPVDFALAQNHPNPFNSETVIGFTIAREADVELVLFDLAGQRIATMVQGHRPAGTYAVRWDGAAANGRQLAAGVYIYRLHAGAHTETRKLLLLR